jgi:hypothetical protein
MLETVVIWSRVISTTNPALSHMEPLKPPMISLIGFQPGLAYEQ